MASSQPNTMEMEDIQLSEVKTLNCNESPLPSGWTAVFDENGKIYYQNHITKQTQWNRPTAWDIVETAPSVVALSVVDGGSVASHHHHHHDSKRRTSSIGERNLSERSCSANLFNIVGILVAIVMIILDIMELTLDDPDMMISIFSIFLAIISLAINIVDYATGDCECLRTGLMIIACLWYFKLFKCSLVCYEKTSVKLLMFFNVILWCSLFYFDLMEFIEKLENEIDGTQKSIMTVLFVTEMTWDLQLKLIKVVAAMLGFGISIVSFLLKMIAKVIGFICKLIFYLCCCFCVISVIIGIAAALSGGGENN